MGKGGNGDGNRPDSRARLAEAPSSPAGSPSVPNDLETAGRDYRRARELLWMAAHDLSAPLGAIRMHLRAKERQHLRQPLTGDDWLAAVARVERLVENAQAMIDDVLAVERLKQRPPATQATGILVDAEQILAAVISMQSAALKRAGCSVFVKRRDDLDNVLGRWNPVSLERLFSNLIRNVIRHAPGAPIEVSFANRDGYLQIHFADGGPGLPFDDGFADGLAPAVAFADSATSEDGHGLGLWIVYRLVAELQGEITMQSRAGKGLAFDIRLPSGEVSGGDQAVESCQP